jgi:sec-independent protein translocase protein TatC
MAGDLETEQETEGGPVKSFLEHLEDFRWVLIKSLVALGLAMLICLFGANYVIAILKWPLSHNVVLSLAQNVKTPWLSASLSQPDTSQIAVVDFGTNHLGNFPISPDEQKALDLGTNHYVAVEIDPITLGTNQVLSWHINPDSPDAADAQKVNVNLVNLSPAGAFFVAFQVALYGGAVLAAPFVIYFIASFIFPALKVNERKHIYPALLFGVALFLTGVSFCYFILMPLALAASQMYSNWLGFGAFEWRAEDYISFVCKFMLGMGIGFELPVVILTLVKMGVLSYRTLRGMWRYMIVIVLFLGAILTTPEVITQVTMAIPLYMLYEITVWIAWYWDRQERKKAAAQSRGA